ncbi:hypothetical protein ACEZ3G_05120 [Maribacter algicola]|uniref:Uncharacterized protein n=1 Tax=Meishania litoralis TaxID=3434685 RepID=A0ACC7LMP7_9FLAO
MEEYIEHKVKTKAEKFFRGFFKVLFMILAAIVFVLLFGYGFMLLWNWLMPDVFGLPMLNYWKAVGLLVMAKLLFSSFGGENKKHHAKPHKRNKSRRWNSCGGDYSKWEMYDEFWKEEGEMAFNNYVERKQQEEK